MWNALNTNRSKHSIWWFWANLYNIWQKYIFQDLQPLSSNYIWYITIKWVQLNPDLCCSKSQLWWIVQDEVIPIGKPHISMSDIYFGNMESSIYFYDHRSLHLMCGVFKSSKAMFIWLFSILSSRGSCYIKNVYWYQITHSCRNNLSSL